MKHHELLNRLDESIRDFAPIELAGLLVVARNELNARGFHQAAALVERGAYLFAHDVSGPDGPSDNGLPPNADNGGVA